MAKSDKALPMAGDVFTVCYPFVRDTYERQDVDIDGVTYEKVPTWRPGVRAEEHQRYCGHGEWDEWTHNVADATGQMVLTVVSVHKPGRFPTRVCFTRQFVTPDGKAFGKGNLRIMTVPAFMRRAQGVWIPYSLPDAEQPVAP